MLLIVFKKNFVFRILFYIFYFYKGIRKIRINIFERINFKRVIELFESGVEFFTFLGFFRIVIEFVGFFFVFSVLFIFFINYFLG